MTLEASNDYYINKVVRVHAGATLTIPECTRLEGSPAPTPGVLAVLRGGRLLATGTAREPILFTTGQRPGERAAGQWGGLYLLGRAPITRPSGVRQHVLEGLGDERYTYGDDVADPEDDSGVLRYVRIEFGGWEVFPGVRPSGLTLAGVGSGTRIDHVMVSNALGDCFHWRGGTVRADYLVANNCGDDYFDGAEGWQGAGTFWFGRRANFAIASLDPHGLEMTGILDESTPKTSFSLSHLTLCGTSQDSLSNEGSYGMVLRELVTGSVDRSVFAGFDYGIDTRDEFDHDDVVVQNSTFGGFVFALDNGLNEASGIGDDDYGFMDASIITEDASNETDPEALSFSTRGCVQAGGPSPDVLASGVGAFADGAGWLDGAWIDWLEE